MQHPTSQKCLIYFNRHPITAPEENLIRATYRLPMVEDQLSEALSLPVFLRMFSYDRIVSSTFSSNFAFPLGTSSFKSCSLFKRLSISSPNRYRVSSLLFLVCFVADHIPNHIPNHT